MTATALTMGSPDLYFAQSESKAVAMGGGLMQLLRDNAPRFVGALKMIGDIAAIFTLNPYMITYSAFSITGRLIAISWGSKKNQQKLAAEPGKEKLGYSWSDSLKKVMRPRQYPVESSAGMSTVGEMFEAIYGGTEIAAGRAGITPLLVGIAAVFAYGIILFGKEENKKDKAAQQEPLIFGQSQSKRVGFFSRMREKLKGSPVQVASLIGLGICAGLTVGSIFEGLTTAYVVYAVIAVVANLTQALFIRKNEFNIEGARDAVAQADSFQNRLGPKRGDSGLQPA